MKCPYRNTESYKYADINGHVVVTAVHRDYEDCYEEQCPYYDQFAYGSDRCKLVNSEVEE